jgi:hypothetical protein
MHAVNMIVRGFALRTLGISNTLAERKGSSGYRWL